MAIVTVADVLEQAEAFEELLARYYSNISTQSVREGVKLLADYMCRHRIRIQEALDRLFPPQLQHVLSAPLRYQPQAADCNCFTGMELPPDATSSQVLDVAMTFDDCLIRLYRQVLQQPVDEETRDLFEGLVRAEQRDQIELKKIKAMDYF